jgi:predicted nucleic acid-binding protein
VLAADADALVSSDGDLLVLDPWHGIPIMTPAQFAK